MAPSRDDQVLLEDAVNVLGNPTDISLVGSRGFQAEASPTGLPSAPAAEAASAMPTPSGAAADAVTGAGEAAAGGGGPGGPTNLQRALQAAGLFNKTLGAANKLQQMPGREANAFDVANTGIQDLGFSLSGAPGSGFIETPLGAMSQQDYSGLLEAFRSGTEGPSGLGMGGFKLGADISLPTFNEAGELVSRGGEAAGAAGAAGTDWGGLAAGGGLAALPIILSALRAAGVDIPEPATVGASLAGMTGAGLAAGLGSSTAASSLGPAGLVALPATFTAMDMIRKAMEPSSDWQSFPARLSQSLTLENAAARHFGEKLLSGEVQNRQQLADLVGQYRGTLGYGPTTYEEGTYTASLGPEYQQYLAGLSDPYALPALPGATGESHEGGQQVDFGPMQGALDQLMAAYQQYLPPGEAGAGNLTPWTLQELGLNRHPLFYNQFWEQQQGGQAGNPDNQQNIGGPGDAGVF